MNSINIIEYLPFLIPILIAQLGLLGYTLHHILTHKTYKIGNRGIWLAVVIILMNFIGPIAYLILGKDDN